MPKKEDLLAKINGLVLVTEENRAHLKKLVDGTTDGAALAKLKELIDQEEHVIEETVSAILKEEIEAGDSRILEKIDEALAEIKRSEQKAAKRTEQLERGGEEKAAEDLLKKLP